MCVRIWRGVSPVEGLNHLDEKSAFRPFAREPAEFFKRTGWALHGNMKGKHS